MHRDEREGLRAYRFDTLPEERVDALVSTRFGGESRAPWASLNLGLRVGDDKSTVVKNRERLFSAYGLPLEQSVWCRQIHRDDVTVVDQRGERGAVDEANIIDKTDALVTDLVGVPLCVTLADCVPVVLYDADHHAVGLAHAGWGGTVNRIASRTVGVMQERYGTDPAVLTCAIGPSISPDRYEVGGEVIDRARAAYGDAPILRDLGGGKALFDLWESNVLDLVSAGVPRERIEVSGISTIDALDEFYSYRFETQGDAPETGRFITAVTLR